MKRRIQNLSLYSSIKHEIKLRSRFLLEIWPVILYYQNYVELVSLEKQVLIRGRHFYALRGIR